MKWASWASLPVLIGTAVAGQTFLTVEEAQRHFFEEADRFEPDQAPSLPRSSRIRLWKALAKGQEVGHVMIDEVIGKREYITYAVGIAPDGNLRGVEILAYRESHGGEVQRERWRRQFVGKTHRDRLTLGVDIQNISGATLSCRSVTEGVRRLVKLHRETFLAQ